MSTKLTLVNFKNVPSLCVLTFSVFFPVSPAPGEELKILDVNDKARALGLMFVADAVKERHVQITMRRHVPDMNGDIPVHIVKRSDETKPWSLCGTGTKLGKYAGKVLTAYHIFEKRGQFGIRIIGPDAIFGRAPVIPIVSVQPLKKSGGDSVICVVDAKLKQIPQIQIPFSQDVFRNWEAGRTYSFELWYRKIWLSTMNNRSMQTLAVVEHCPGKFYVFFEWNSQIGESGTGATVEGFSPNDYLVVVANREIPREFIDMLFPIDRERFRWSPGKLYAVGNLAYLSQEDL